MNCSESGNNFQYLRVIRDYKPKPAVWNLALEEAIGRQVNASKSPPTLRLWRNQLSVIIGRSQSCFAEVDVNRCQQQKVTIVRRASGGGTVLHHKGNLNYSIYLPEQSSASVSKSQQHWNKVLQAALQELTNLPVNNSTNGLFIEDNKISGTAQSRRWGLIHHGTLLLTETPESKAMKDFIKAPRKDYRKEANKIPSKPSSVTYLDREANFHCTNHQLYQLESKMVTFLSNRLKLPPTIGSVSNQERQLGQWLRTNKYMTKGWTQHAAKRVATS